jgi:filamentous hemagglutinin family protein
LNKTLSNGSALPGPNFNIPAELGKTVGINLFHSFHEFNLQIGESATFTGPDRIQNILSRVTGGNESYINGLIESKIDGANLYLLNPNGFIFGENSQVSVEGSFTVSTHEGIRFGEGQFNAVDPDKSVLVVSDAKSFGFFGDNPLGDIVVNGGFLSVSGAKKSIALAGNQVTIQDDAYIRSENGGNVDIQASSLAVLSGSEIAVYGSKDHQGGQINVLDIK